MILFMVDVIGSTKDNMVVTMILVRMGGNDIRILSTKEALGKFFAYFMSLL